jgi:hypothetical protein
MNARPKGRAIRVDVWEGESDAWRCPMFFRILSTAFFSVALFSSAAFAGSENPAVLQCRKQNWMIPSSYHWVEIVPQASGDLIFQYGTGIDTQLIEVLYQSPIQKISDTQYAYQGDGYRLNVEVQRGRLDFEVVSPGRRQTRKKFTCL